MPPLQYEATGPVGHSQRRFADPRNRSLPQGALLLALTTALLLFANGRNTVATAAWLAPIFLLRFVRTVRPLFALPCAAALLFLVWMFQFRGMVPAPPPVRIAVAAAYGLAGLLPYAFDRALAGRVRGIAATLVFPTAAVTFEFLFCSFCPYGSWGSVAYTQYGDLPLLQILAVTGIYGISFLVMWLAGVANYAWEEG